VVLSVAMALRLSGIEPANVATVVAALLVFGLLLNRGYADTVGLTPRPVTLDTPLGIPRASLVASRADRDLYQRVVALVNAHAGTGALHAFPDCPEIYVLSGRANPTPSNYEFFTPLDDAELEQLWRRRDVSVLVINLTPGYSRPPDSATLVRARRLFPGGEVVGRFEVRWR
jgi:hypothetical protein